MVSPSPQSAAQAPPDWLTRALRPWSATHTAETMTWPAGQDCWPAPRTTRNCCWAAAPAAPAGPGGPAGPAAPAGPATPRSPGLPSGPCGPAGPCGPCSPRGPGAPAAPAGPAGPASPRGPADPAGPCSPRWPAGPAGPGAGWPHAASRKAPVMRANGIDMRICWIPPEVPCAARHALRMPAKRVLTHGKYSRGASPAVNASLEDRVEHRPMLRIKSGA